MNSFLWGKLIGGHGFTLLKAPGISVKYPVRYTNIFYILRHISSQKVVNLCPSIDIATFRCFRKVYYIASGCAFLLFWGALLIFMKYIRFYFITTIFNAIILHAKMKFDCKKTSQYAPSFTIAIDRCPGLYYSRPCLSHILPQMDYNLQNLETNKLQCYIFCKIFSICGTYLTRHHFYSYPINQKSLFLSSPNFSGQDCKSRGLCAKGLLSRSFFSCSVKSCMKFVSRQNCTILPLLGNPVLTCCQLNLINC